MLPKRNLQTLRAVAECLFYDGVNEVPSERLDWLLDDVNSFANNADAAVRAVLRAASTVLEMAPLLTAARPKRLSSLPREERVVYLERLDSSPLAPLSLLFGATKVILAMIYFEHPEALALTGYGGECMKGTLPGFHPHSERG